MKRVILVAAAAALALIGAILLSGAWRARGEAAAARLERSRIKREFSERAALGRTLPAEPPDLWREEAAALLRGYLDAVAAVRNRYPGEPARPSALQAAEGEKRKLDEKGRATLADFQKYADDRFALLRGARYAPVASAVAEGLRLDLISIQPGPSPEGGGPGLRIDFALWGVPRLLEREGTGERTTSRTVLPVSLRRLAFQFLDEKGVAWGEMSGGGEPYQRLADPERFVEDFPPSILFGTWWVELFPRPPATVNVTLEASLRGATGRERPAVFEVSLPIDESWRLPPGAEFKAETREGAPPPEK
jgi:hypothetical protein